MKFYIDTANFVEIDKWRPIIDGITTNPLIESETGPAFKVVERYPDLPVSIDLANLDVEDIVLFSRDFENAVIKVPLLTGIKNSYGSYNLDKIHQLVQAGVKVNCTANMSLPQVMIAEALKVAYVSVFVGRCEDEGDDVYTLVKNCSSYVWSQRMSQITEGTELIVGSVRTLGHIMDAAKGGADIVTVKPALLEKMMNHEKSVQFVRECSDARNK